jgi:hypothetical protein
MQRERERKKEIDSVLLYNYSNRFVSALLVLANSRRSGVALLLFKHAALRDSCMRP